jgi:hypothetical protein
MLGNQAPDDFQVLGAKPTPLHHLGNKHSQLLADSIFWKPEKIFEPLFTFIDNAWGYDQGQSENAHGRSVFTRWISGKSLSDFDVQRFR